LRVVAAILVDACAFFLWNLSSRSPAQLARDIAGGARQAGSAVRGFTRFTAGALLLLAGGVLLLPLALRPQTFTILETWAVITGLLVEHLIGADLRARSSH
jgi:hypothetical protein